MTPAVRNVALTAVVFVLLLAVADRAFVATFTPQTRLSENFSGAYVAMEFARLRDEPPQTIFLGDSVLWGYKLRSDQTAIQELRERGIAAVNLAYEGGSPVNTYAVLQALFASGVKPARVVFNVNQKVFNAADSAYAKVHPSIFPLSEPSFDARDRALLAAEPRSDSPDARIDRAVSHIWALYAMRTDVRERLFGDVDAAHALDAAVERFSGATARADAAHAPTADKFEGTYDLGPLDESNVSVHFLERTAERLRTAGIPGIAILTPTNHTLLHDYIDTPEYTRNLAYVERLLERRGIRVVDLDRAFGARDFIDNDHLTGAANRRLAKILARELARS